ncbi:hypothetical protein BDE02_17G020900 [Populus trichocarpa]|nr:hypothetical protein BDE02_17G020900 [Populus trichocarpa]
MQRATVAIIGAISDLMKHLQKCLQNSSKFSNPRGGSDGWNADLQFALKRISQLSDKAFPDALFHQLLVAMAHPDHETRFGAHSVFSILLMPSLFSPWSDQDKKTSEAVSETFGASASQKRSNSISNVGEKHDSHDHLNSFWHAAPDGKMLNVCWQLTSLRLSSRQISHLLSSLWVQATSAENMPTNFEAMSHTYNITLLSTRSKASSHMALVRCFQLAVSLAQEESDDGKIAYGSEEEDVAALKSLSHVEADNGHLKETLTSQFMTKFVKLSEDELSGIKQQLLQEFSPDDAYPSGAPLFMDTPRPCSPLARMEFQAFEEGVSQIMPAAALTDDETFTELNGSQSGPRTSISIHTLDILSVKELLEPMKSQCEALVTGKQQKMSILHSFKPQAEAKVFPIEEEKKDTSVYDVKVELPQCDLKLAVKEQIRTPDQLSLCSLQYGQNSFRLPPSSP